MTEAPDLFEYDPDGHCFVRKQPTTSEEVDRMIAAFKVQEVGCIRYKGTTKAIQIRLVEAGEGEQCDVLDPEFNERNATIQAERTARLAKWRADQAVVQESAALQSNDGSTAFRRFLRWLGIRT